MTVKERVSDAIQRESMFPSGCAVVVGLSGGADSVTLLHVLLELRQELNLSQIVAVHVNHQMRGEESYRDEEFARALCREWNVPFFVYTYDVKTLATAEGKGIEEKGRELRYAAFREVASRFPLVRIATAHTASDNTETVLLHMCRGCGLNGLIGIRPVRENIVRPLLDCFRDDIETYCNERGLNYMVDSTNTDVAYARNRVRYELLPSLRHINESVEKALLRLSQNAKEVEEFINKQADVLWEAVQHPQSGVFKKEPLLGAEAALCRVVLRRMIRQAGSDSEDGHIARIMELLPVGGAVSLPQGYVFRVLRRTVSVCKPTATMASKVQTPVKIGMPVYFAGDRYRIFKITRKEYEQKLNNQHFMFKNHLDCDMISGELFLRSRQAGDAYRPLGRKCQKKLKDLFNEAAVSTENRATVPLLCDEKGIVMPYGFACDERVRVTDQTKEILVFEKE